jgi:pyruvate dehydrogenase E1 component alpha subunit
VEEWKKKCPVAFMEQQLLEMGIVDANELKIINAEVMSQVQEAVEYAINSPLPNPEDALEDIFSK